MKHKSIPFFVPLVATALLAAVVLGCSDDECPNRNSDLFYLDNCDSPSESSSRETEIIKECRENIIADTTYLRQHVLGTWQLIGAGSFWGTSPSTPVEYSYQSINFDVDSVSLVYLSRSGEVDSVLDFGYSIELRQVFSNDGELLTEYSRVETEDYVRDLASTRFCEQFAFFDQRFQDGQFKIFQKQN